MIKWGQQTKFIVMSGHASPGVEGNGVDIAALFMLVQVAICEKNGYFEGY
jgi:hypothetical protein